MARPPVVRNFVTSPHVTIEGWKERFMDLVAAANRGDTTADGELEAIAAGVYASYTTWMSRDTQATRNNLGACVRAGVCSLRRCPECTLWFLAFKKTQHTCRRLECRTAYRKADARRRAAKSRQTPGARRERELQRRPRVTKTGT